MCIIRNKRVSVTFLYNGASWSTPRISGTNAECFVPYDLMGMLNLLLILFYVAKNVPYPSISISS